ncbi:MAG: nucleoid-associated protein, partial [Maribacter sp.]
MINLYATQIENISIHRVGNKNKNEGVFLSSEPFALNDETTGLLKEYFFKPFREKEENYFKFTNEVDVEFNELYKIASEIFSD